MNLSRTTRTETRVNLRMTGKELLELLRRDGQAIPKSGVDVTVRVPGGGDWSNMNLDIDDDTPIQISFTEITTEGT